MKIIDNVYLVPGVMANTYILVDDDGLTIIDVGLPRSEKKILAYIASLGKSARDVKRILLTHADLDHVGSLAVLKAATGARTYSNQVEAGFIAAGKSPRPDPPGFSVRKVLLAIVRPFFKATPIQVDEFLTDGQVLPVLGGLQVIDTAGHTPGHLSLFAPKFGILFCGDSLVNDEKGIHGSRHGMTWDESKARAAERKQAALGARIICSGHGPVVTDAAHKFTFLS